MAKTKTLAKLANRAAMDDPSLGGVADLREERIRRGVMEGFAVGDVWGIGRATVAKLAALDIMTAAELAAMPMRQARGLGTVVLERLVAELNGVPAAAVETLEAQRKGMAVTRSFGTPVREFEILMGALANTRWGRARSCARAGSSPAASSGPIDAPRARRPIEVCDEEPSTGRSRRDGR